MDASVELVKHLLQSVVHIHTNVSREHPAPRILGDERLGTGVVVDGSGLILTVNYVVMGGQAIDVAFHKGRRAKAEIVAQDFEIGLALLRVKRQGLVAAVMGASEAVERSQEGVLLGAMGPQERRVRSEEHTSELQSRLHLGCRLLLEKKKVDKNRPHHQLHT